MTCLWWLASYTQVHEYDQVTKQGSNNKPAVKPVERFELPLLNTYSAKGAAVNVNMTLTVAVDSQ